MKGGENLTRPSASDDDYNLNLIAPRGEEVKRALRRVLLNTSYTKIRC